MSTSTQPLKYLFTAKFSNGDIIIQSEDDRYSKHIEGAEWNPTAFRDVLDHGDQPILFFLSDVAEEISHVVDLKEGRFCSPQIGDNLDWFSLEDEPLTDRKLIYYRVMRKEFMGDVEGDPYVHEYVFGYEGKNRKGEVEKKVVHIDG